MERPAAEHFLGALDKPLQLDARSPVRKVAYVSCDAGSFARDVKVMIEHGFQLTRVTPVDQFRWSPHVEVVGALER